MKLLWAMIIILSLPLVARAQAATSDTLAPMPQPLKTDIRVGAYIFPGGYRDTGTTDYPYKTIDEVGEWRLMAKFAHPRPLLGFYDDSRPEVNDWQIKWAREAGIGFFAFDWYWNAGEKRLMRTLEQGFLKARHADQMDFCIHWCNHTVDWQKPLDFSPAALEAMIGYCADQYFTRPNYLKMAGNRPVFMVFDIDAVHKANGGDAAFTRDVLPRLNAICHAKGLGDLYLVAVFGSSYHAHKAAGLDALTVYGYAEITTTDVPDRPGSAPYAEVAEAQPEIWQRLHGLGVPYLVSTMSGWDDTPRTLGGGDGHMRWVRPGGSAALFEASLRAGKAQVRPELPFFMVEAWNEWGEGSTVEPSKEYGFSYLDAIRRVFASDPAEGAAAHAWAQPTPEQVESWSVLKGTELAAARAREGQPDPPPPVHDWSLAFTPDPAQPPAPVLKEFRFDGADTVKQISLCHDLEFKKIREGRAVFQITGLDPSILFRGDFGPLAGWRGSAMRVCYDDRQTTGVTNFRLGEYFWQTDTQPLGHDTRTFPMRPGGDGAIGNEAKATDTSGGMNGAVTAGPPHTYQVTPRPDKEWPGQLKAVRFDFPSVPGATIELEWVRVYGGTS